MVTFLIVVIAVGGFLAGMTLAARHKRHEEALRKRRRDRISALADLDIPSIQAQIQRLQQNPPAAADPVHQAMMSMVNDELGKALAKLQQPTPPTEQEKKAIASKLRAMIEERDD